MQSPKANSKNQTLLKKLKHNICSKDSVVRNKLSNNTIRYLLEKKCNIIYLRTKGLITFGTLIPFPRTWPINKYKK